MKTIKLMTMKTMLTLSVLTLLFGCGRSNSNKTEGNSSATMSDGKSHSVLILSSSPRNDSNSELLCDEFARGATEAGHAVERINLNDVPLHFLSVKDYSQPDTVSDVAPHIVDKMIKSDVIVMATPTWFYAMSGQMKTMIDRTFTRHQEIKGKQFYFIISSATPDTTLLQPIVQEFRGFLAALPDAVERGVIYGSGSFEKGSVRDKPAMRAAYMAGKGI